jgi:cytochrome oxidase assembly protein ShyY1
LRLPLFASAVVLTAVAVMIGLGLWQVARAQEKEALLARYEAASGLAPLAGLPTKGEVDGALFRRLSAVCEAPSPSRVVAGRNQKGRSGFVHWVECRDFKADIGWSDRPAPVRWGGGPLSGIVAPDQERGYRLVSAEGQAGLAPSAPPNVEDVPNNHRSYAFQWFAFALAALVIYGLALRGRRERVA